jgi:hypothetical protein
VVKKPFASSPEDADDHESADHEGQAHDDSADHFEGIGSADSVVAARGAREIRRGERPMAAASNTVARTNKTSSSLVVQKIRCRRWRSARPV